MEDRQPDSGQIAELEKPGNAPANLPVLYDPGRSQPGFLQRLLYVFRPQSYASMRANLEDALAAKHGGDQTFTPEERAMLHNILRLREVRVEDVMIPRADIEAIDIHSTLGELITLFQTSGHSRMPVYDENLDDPRGMVHIRDVLAYLAKTGVKKRRRNTKSGQVKNGEAKTETSAAIGAIDLSQVDLAKTIEELKVIREVLFVPPSMLASVLMARMQASRIQMALVIDEYGGTDGLVSLEDIVEMVVGDIEDEHDDEAVYIEEKGEGIYVMDARVELEELETRLGKEFLDAAKQEDEDVDTIGGLIFSLLGRVPVRGEVIPSFGGCEIEVLGVDPRRIKQVRIARLKHPHRRRNTRRDTTQTAGTQGAQEVPVSEEKPAPNKAD